MGAGAGAAVGGPPGAVVGGAGGAFAVNDMLLAGEAVRQFEQSGVDPYDAARAAHVIAPFMAALDTFGLMKVLRGPMRGQTDNMLKYIGKRMAHGASVESVTEMSQGIIRELTDAKLTGDPKAEARAKAIIEEGIIAGLTGGVVSGAASPFGRRQKAKDTDRDTSGLPPEQDAEQGEASVEGEFIPGDRTKPASVERARRGRTYQQKETPKPAIEGGKKLAAPGTAPTEPAAPATTGTLPAPQPEKQSLDDVMAKLQAVMEKERGEGRHRPGTQEKFAKLKAAIERRREALRLRYEDLTGQKTPVPTGRTGPPARRFGIDAQGRRFEATPSRDLVLGALSGDWPTDDSGKLGRALVELEGTPDGDAVVAALVGHEPSPESKLLTAALSRKGPPVDAETLSRVLSGLGRSPVGKQVVRALSGEAPATPVDAAAAQTDTEPSEAQKEAGNYKKGTVNIQGLDVAIENPEGTERRGTDPDGNEWSVTMPAHYGYVKRTEGADGDQVDVYVGKAPEAGTVFVVNQVDAKTKKFNEHKAFIGFADQTEVESTYDAAFDDGKGPERRQSIVPMQMDEFKKWLKDGDTKKKVSASTAQAATEAVGAQRIKRDVGQGVDRSDRIALVEYEEVSVTPKGRDVPVRYGVVEMSDVVASHDAEGRPNAAYPEALQPRDRTSKQSQDQITEFSSEGRFNPNLLMPSPSTDTGPPLLGRDLAVESGNGRMAVLQRVYGRDGTGGMRYRAAVEQWAERQGVGERTRGMRHPVLVRMRTDDADRRSLAIESNIDTKLAPSATEQAQTDAERIGGLDAIGNKGARDIDRLFAESLTSGERGSLVLPDGSLSQAGQQRIKNAVLWEGWRSSRLQRRATEAETEGYKRVVNVFHKSALAAAAARFHGADLAPIVEGLDYYLESQDKGQAVDFRLAQIDVFAESTLPGDSEVVARALDEATSEKQVTAVIEAGLGELRARGEQKTIGDLVGGRIERPLAALMNQALAEARGQTDMFAAPAPKKPAPKPKAPPKAKAMFTEDQSMVPVDKGADRYTDLTADAMKVGITPFDQAGHQAAVDWVLARGRQTGHENVVLLDSSNGTVHAGTAHKPGQVAFSPDAMERMKDPSAQIVLYHNHPGDRALSKQDVSILAAYPGLRVMVAVGHGGNFTSVRLAPGALEVLEALAKTKGPNKTPYSALIGLYRQVNKALKDVVLPLVQADAVPRPEAEHWHADTVNRILAKLGFTEYETNQDLPVDQMERLEGVYDAVVKRKISGLRDRLAGSVRATEGVVGVLDQLARSRPGRPGRAGSEAGSGRAPRRSGVREHTGLTPPRPLKGESLTVWNQLAEVAGTSISFREFRNRLAAEAFTESEAFSKAVGSLEQFYANVKGDVYERRGTMSAGANPDVRRVQVVVDRVTGEWDAGRMPYVRVVPNAQALPQGIQRRLGDSIGQTRGILVQHETQPVIYLIADKLRTNDEIQRTLIHEAVGHLSMMDMMGDDFRPLLARVWAEREAPIYRPVFDEVSRSYPDADPERLAAEMIAHMAERRMKNPIMTRIVEAVRRFLRDLGFRLAISWDEVMGLLARADRRLRERAPVETSPDSQQVRVGQALDAFKDLYESRDGKKRAPILDPKRPVESLFRILVGAVRRARCRG